MKNYKTYQIVNLFFNSCERFKKINLGLTFFFIYLLLTLRKKQNKIEKHRKL